MKIIIKTKEDRVPFSRNILANSLHLAGLNFIEAYEIAEKARKYLEKKGVSEVDSAEIVKIVREALGYRKDKSVERYCFWRDFKKKKAPLIILLGGGTGVGTTRIGLELSRRLLISHISTDIIRSVLRSVIPDYLVPALHTSSFLSGAHSKHLDSLPGDKKTLAGFIQHIEPIIRSVDFALTRAIKEGLPMILEGVSLVPGFIPKEILSHPFVHFFMMDADPKTHYSRFKLREYHTKQRRPAEKYLDRFKEIRTIHQYILEQAGQYNVPVIKSDTVEECTTEILDLVTSRMMESYKS